MKLVRVGGTCLSCSFANGCKNANLMHHSHYQQSTAYDRRNSSDVKRAARRLLENGTESKSMNKLPIRLFSEFFGSASSRATAVFRKGWICLPWKVAVTEQICSQCGKSQQVLYFMWMLSSIGNRGYTS